MEMKKKKIRNRKGKEYQNRKRGTWKEQEERKNELEKIKK